MKNKKTDNQAILEKPPQTNSKFGTILLLTVLSLAAGISGAFFAKAYLFKDSNSYPGNEINIPQDSLRRANLIIENAKKIVVEQDDKVKETIASGRNNIVGIFKKINPTPKTASSSEKNFLLSDYYNVNENLAEGLIITSDGWIIASDLPKNIDKKDLIGNYTVITKSKDVYNIDKIIETGVDSYLFLHLSEAKDLPVKGLSALESLNEGQLLVAVNWQGKSYLSSLFDKNRPSSLIQSSDSPTGIISLSDSLEKFFSSAFIFSLNGEAAAIYNQKSGVLAIDNFLPIIKGLLEKKEVKYPTLGVSYVNLSILAIKDPRYERGALLYAENKKNAIEAGGAGEEAGLKNGDIILSIDSTRVDSNNDLSDIIRNYRAGDEINIIYLRNGQENITKTKLKELKISAK